MHTEAYGYAKCVPTQLFEALFLLLLFFVAAIRVRKNKSYNLPLYMITYGAWRFFIEFFRSDDRGQLLTKALSPSQVIACIMIVGGIALMIFERYYEKRHSEEISLDAKSLLERRQKRKEENNAGEK